MKKVSVVIPSRLGKGADGNLLIVRAIESVAEQNSNSPFEIIIGLDQGVELPEWFDWPHIRHSNSDTKGQIAALNAAVAKATGECLAFLEDDDTWEPEYLSIALGCLEREADFVSSTQLERDETGQVLRINDFPTPSGWVMRRQTFDKVGPFDPATKWHTDNDWLGRLSLTDARRVHLVEATAPIEPMWSHQVRPWLCNAAMLGGPNVRLARHGSPWPLVNRGVHSGQGTHTVANDPNAKAESNAELQRLMDRYGRCPW